MRGLLLKDFYNISKLGKQYAVIFLVMTVWAYFMKNPSFICLYAILCTANLVLSSLSFDENAKFDKYVLTMPVKKELLVQEKYVLMFLLVGFGTICGILLAQIMNLMIPTEDFVEMAVSALAIAVFFLISHSLIFPKIFREGVEKARIPLIGIYMLIFAVVYLGVKYLQKNAILKLILENPWLALAGLLLLTAGVIAVSYKRSIKVIREKEW